MQLVKMSILSSIKNLINLATMNRGSDGVYQITTLNDETVDNVRYMQPFGFKGEPPKGSKALAAFRAGKKDAGTILVIESDSGAVALSEGEVVVYNNHGASVHLKADGTTEVKGGDVNIAAGSLKVSGIQVVTSQQATIIPPVGGGTVDAQARATITNIITTMQSHGLIS